MFLNFILDEELRPYTGVDVSGLFDVDSSCRKAIIKKWERTMMGLRSYPFTCTQKFVWSEDVISWDHLDPENILGWNNVVLNIPGDKGYGHTKPQIYHFNSVTGHMDSSFTTYIDNIRT